MKKSLLAIGLSLSMVLAMATPAFAAISTDTNKNADGTAVTAPGIPGTAQVAGESFNAASITNKTGVNTPTTADWETVNDDDAVAKAADTAADINVWAKVVDSGSKIYKVDLAWGAMKFEYNSGSGQWNTTSHAYDSTGGTAAWTVGYLDGANNKVAVTNHSNNAINAGFAFTMNGTTFNDKGTTHNVVSNFFDTNAKALAAALVLTNTFTAADGPMNDAAVADKLTGSKIALPTADAYNNGTANQTAGARTSDVFFAFSGSPDAGKGKTMDTFRKVGVITVTVTPNNETNLNNPTTP